MMENNRTVEQAKESMLRAIPHFRYALTEAAKEGKPKLGILAEHLDGGGRVTMSFDCEDFFSDLALILEAAPQTMEDDMRVKAQAFLRQHELTVIHRDDKE